MLPSGIPIIGLMAAVIIVIISVLLYLTTGTDNKKEQFQNSYTEEQITKAKTLLSKQNITFTEFKFNMPEMDAVDFNTFKSM